MERNAVIGILAHVDAGKTTLSEALLYHAGVRRTLGRVDHGDAFLDTDVQERKRGITIYGKTALFTYKGVHFTLLDGSFFELLSGSLLKVAPSSMLS